MASLLAGRSSVEQDEEVVRRMRATPRTPVKTTNFHNGTSTGRRRGLFQPASPASSECSGELGKMSLLSSSNESLESLMDCIPETPVRVPRAEERPITVRSSLFPALTPKPRRSPRLTPSMRESVAMLEDIVADNDSNSCLTPRSSRQGSRRFVAETITSPSSVGTPPSQRKPQIPQTTAKESPTKILQPVSPEDFYGPQPKNNSTVTATNFYAPAAPRATLLIDTLGSRGRRIRRDSVVSQLSSVSAVSKRSRSTSGSTSRSVKRHKGTIPGVWHGLKKPKKMKKNAPKPKPTMSPNTRLHKLKGQTEKNKPEKLFEEKPRKRVAASKEYDFEGLLVDSSPSPLIKHKKALPVREPEPDLRKKFVKHGPYRPATITLNNIKLEFQNGKIHMETPRKVRISRPKKIAPTLDPVDFSVTEPEIDAIQGNVENILKQLCGTPSKTPQPEAGKMSNSQVLDILESPKTKENLVATTPRKVMAEIQGSPQSPPPKNIPLNEAQTKNVKTQANAGTQLYPVFDPSTWKNTVQTRSPKNSTHPRKKDAFIPDDQYFLDAGQREIGPIICKQCSMMYEPGDCSDEMIHNRVHNNMHELKFKGWASERVVAQFEDGRVVCITFGDPKAWLQRAKDVVGVIDQELGFAENFFKWTKDKKVFLFVSKKHEQIVGCLVSEKCSKGYRMYPPVEGMDIDTCQRDSTPCKIGINRIWTEVRFRRKKIATRLFQILCSDAGNIEADDVAFSIPSPDGKFLARSLVKRDDVKVYGFV